MMQRLCGAWLILLCTVSPAWALEVTVSGDGGLTVTYLEPTTNADGTPLTDLAKTNVYIHLPGDGPVKGPDVPASRAQGGGAITTQVTVLERRVGQNSVAIWVTATDSFGNESLPSAVVRRRIERLSPAAPQ